MKSYVRSPAFEPQFLQPISDGIIEPSDTWIGHFPSFDAVPTSARSVNAVTFRSVVAAIRRGEAIEVRYQSLSRPEPKWRWITPHAVGFDGFRWHARAYCHTYEAFKDFLLSRMLEARATRRSDITLEGDRDWHGFVTLEIGPHPDLSQTQKRVIALDYGMRGGSVKIKVRRAFLYYALRRFGLDTKPEAKRPQDQQIVLLNRDAVMAELPGGKTGVSDND